ncbi:hypothetical protein K469DRAFT_756568 [Zopfia rhizophila CBS 207.26]|uniref:Uncharacterized protein n=1 Tax=Zopfia rhizophila CBS 207.26 TaxID=1314779 RepID=A0A6A6DA96_9PEZI|nr:hypothetical protein K469DRAFT_756568 [Zopfia rhizophila CBS 207.26]
MQLIRDVAQFYGPPFGYHWGLVEKYSLSREEVLINDPDKVKAFGANISHYGAGSDFKGLSESPLIFTWPVKVLTELKYSSAKDESFLDTLERKRIHKYFRNPREEDDHVRESVQLVLADPTTVGVLSDSLYKQEEAFMSIFRNKTTQSYPHRVCLGIHLFLETCRLFPWEKDGKPNNVNSLIKVLQFSKEIQTSLQAVGAVDRGVHIELNQSTLLDLSKLLRAFSEDKCFDLYYQFLWVAGSHIATWPGITQGIGLLLVEEGGLKILFGKRPTMNFNIIWRSELRKMRIVPEQFSLFVSQYRSQYKGDSALLAPLVSDGKDKRFKPDIQTRNKYEKLRKKNSAAEILVKVQKSVEPEFQCALPVAKTDFFAVCRLCIEIMKDVAARYCAPGGVLLELMTYKHDTSEGGIVATLD